MSKEKKFKCPKCGSCEYNTSTILSDSSKVFECKKVSCNFTFNESNLKKYMVDVEPEPTKKTERIKIPKPATGRGYIGVWSDGGVGWCGVNHIGVDEPRLSDKFKLYARNGCRAFLCKIVATPILTKNGRPITRILRKV